MKHMFQKINLRIRKRPDTTESCNQDISQQQATSVIHVPANTNLDSISSNLCHTVISSNASRQNESEIVRGSVQPNNFSGMVIAGQTGPVCDGCVFPDPSSSESTRTVSQVPAAPARTTPNRTSPNNVSVFRVKGISLKATKEDVLSILETKFTCLGNVIKVKTLAVTASGQNQAATITFEKIPEHLEVLKDRSSWGLEHSAVAGLQYQRTWAIDSNFHGLTVLHSPPVETHKVDIIAISGLGGHAYGSFKERRGRHMWLSDSLPFDIPTARVAIYGYESTLENSISFQNLRDLGNRFAKAVQSLKTVDSPHTPIIFIAHSLGGLIVKEAIIQLGSSIDSRISKVFHSIYGALFFGVPNDGLDISSFIPIVKDGPNRSLIEDLGQSNSHVLNTQRQMFQRVFNDEKTEIHCFYETCKSKTAIQDDNGRWSMDGEPRVLVNTSSATHCRPWEDISDHVCPLDRDHSSLVKFSDHDSDYETVLGVLQIMIKKADFHVSRTADEVKKSTLLKSLQFEQIEARRDTIKKAHAQTCKWLLKNAEYLDWINSRKLQDTNGLLWIKGKPGAGKSTLMKFLLDTHTNQNMIVVYFFFNARGGDLEKSTIGMYRSILFQLLEHHPKPEIVYNNPRFSRSNQGSMEWSLESLKEMFEHAVLGIGNSKLMCLIDALDECHEDQIRDMISSFASLGDLTTSSGVVFQFCFASRHYPHITIAKGLVIILEHQKGHFEDIRSYVHSELMIQPIALAEKIRMSIQDKAAGVFMWVVLVVGILQRQYDKGRTFDLEKMLHDIPEDLHALFRDILARDNDYGHDLLLCIQWVLFARRPLKPKELFFAILSGQSQATSNQDPSQVTDSDALRYILSCSKGLVEATKSPYSTVQFIHESIRDFLLKEGGLEEIWLGNKENVQGMSHDRLKQCCDEYIKMSAKGLGDQGTPPQTAEIYEATYESYPFLQYADSYILYHADTADGLGITQVYFLEAFNFQDWMKYRRFPSPPLYHYTPQPSPLYILAGHNMSNLIRFFARNNSCFAVEEQRYGIPILAGLATRSYGAVHALLEVEADKEPHIPLLRDLSDKYYHENRRKPSGCGSKFARLPKNLITCLVESDEATILAFVLATGKYAGESDKLDEQGWTPLHRAVSKGLKRALDVLLEHDAQIEAVNLVGDTALLVAVRKGNESIVKMLLQRGAHIEATDIFGHTPLSIAVEKAECLSITRMLMENGANLDVTDHHGRTPLLWAIQHPGNEAMVQLLLDGGAQIDSADDDGRTPLSWAVQNPENKAMAQLLLDGGAQIDSVDKDGRTPLSWAIQNPKNKAMVQLLLDRGARVESADKDGRTALSRAAGLGFTEIAELLLERGAQVESADKDGRTPLSWAAGTSSLSMIIHLLLDNGAQIRSVDKNGTTPFIWAIQNPYNEAIMYQLLGRDARQEGGVNLFR